MRKYAGRPVGNLREIPGGDVGVKETLRTMSKHARKGSVNPAIRALAGRIVRGSGLGFLCAVKDFNCEANKLFTWVKKNIRWTRDVDGVETIQSPERTLDWKFGDCDDLSTLLAALALSIGIPVKFRAIAADTSRPNSFSHVYVLLNVNGQWIPADPSIPKAKLGWEYPKAMRKIDWPLEN